MLPRYIEVSAFLLTYEFYFETPYCVYLRFLYDQGHSLHVTPSMKVVLTDFHYNN